MEWMINVFARLHTYGSMALYMCHMCLGTDPHLLALMAGNPYCQEVPRLLKLFWLFCVSFSRFLTGSKSHQSDPNGRLKGRSQTA